MLLPVLTECGYQGVYTNKDSRQREGLATFWKTTAFLQEPIAVMDFPIKMLLRREEEEEDKDEELRGRGKREEEGGGDENWQSIIGIRNLIDSHRDLEEVMLEKIGTVVSIVVLKLKFGGENIVIANTHLFFHPLADHIRALQVFAVCRKCHQVSEKFNAKGLIVGGDFNSDPLSGAAQLLFTKCLLPGDSSFLDCWKNLHVMKASK